VVSITALFLSHRFNIFEIIYAGPLRFAYALFNVLLLFPLASLFWVSFHYYSAHYEDKGTMEEMVLYGPFQLALILTGNCLSYVFASTIRIMSENNHIPKLCQRS
jgi:hypothetical protein